MALLRQDNTPDKLFLGGSKFRQETFTAGGALTYPAGMLVGQLTASGKYVPYNSAGVAGEQVAVGVLSVEFVATGAGDTELRVMVAGEAYQDELTAWNGGTPIALTELEVTALRDFGIVAVESLDGSKLDN